MLCDVYTTRRAQVTAFLQDRSTYTADIIGLNPDTCQETSFVVAISFSQRERKRKRLKLWILATHLLALRSVKPAGTKWWWSSEAGDSNPRYPSKREVPSFIQFYGKRLHPCVRLDQGEIYKIVLRGRSV